MNIEDSIGTNCVNVARGRQKQMDSGTPRRKIILTLAVALTIALSIALAGCGVFENRDAGDESIAGTGDTDAAGATAEQVFAVNVTPAIEGQIADYLEVNGDVQTTTSVDIFSSTAGEVARVHVRVGESVIADQLIVEVDASRPGQTFAPSPVRSPIAGTVTRLPVRVGSQVTPSTPVAQVSRTNELEIVVPIAERFISKVRTGLDAEVRLDAFPDRTFAARVTELNPVVDPLTRTLEVKLRFTRPDPRIRAGMFAEVRIITEQKDNIVKIPADVLIRRFGETFVFVVHESDRERASVERRRVNPGILIDNTLEITEGLKPGELVVYQGQALLEDDVAVRIINRLDVLEGGAQ